LLEFVYFSWVVIVYRLSGRDFLHPAFVILIIWSVGVLAIDISASFYPMTLGGGLLAFVFIAISSVGALTTKIFKINGNRFEICLKHTQCDEHLLSLLVYISAVGCVVMLISFVQEIQNYDDIAAYFYFSRVAELKGEPLVVVSWLYAQFPPLGFVTSLFVFVERFKQKKITINVVFTVLLVALTSISLSISGTRSVLIIYLLLLLVIYLGGRNIPFWKTIVVGFIFITVFALSSYFMRASEADKASMSLFEILAKNISIYIFGGIKGFDVFQAQHQIIYHEVFSTLFDSGEASVMSFFNLGFSIESNVYSFFAVYVHYFGWFIGAILVYFIFFAVGLIYEIRFLNVFCFLLSKFALTATVLTVFHDYFFSLFPYIFRTLIIYLILYKIRPIRLLLRGRKICTRLN